MLALRRLTKTYASFRLGPISLSVSDEVLAVLGPSGCGKTTLLSLIAGLTTPNDGTITLNDTRLDGLPPNHRGVGLVFQDGALFPHMTARENIAYAADTETVVESLADRLEITPILEQPASTLSGGESQRVALARTLAADPAALLLDEPLAALDAPIKRRLRDELRGVLAALDIPVLYVTHNQNQASIIGDRIAVLADGELQQVGPPTAIYKQPATPFVARFTGSENVFEATVNSTDGDLELGVGPYVLTVTNPTGLGDRETVRCCIRPEYIELAFEPTELPPNGLYGTVEHTRYTGHAYRVTIAIDGVKPPFQAIVPAPRFETTTPEPGCSVTVTLPADALHIIPPQHSPPDAEAE